MPDDSQNVDDQLVLLARMLHRVGLLIGTALFVLALVLGIVVLEDAIIVVFLALGALCTGGAIGYFARELDQYARTQSKPIMTGVWVMTFFAVCLYGVVIIVGAIGFKK